MNGNGNLKKTGILLLTASLFSVLLGCIVLFLSACNKTSPIESNVTVQDGGITVQWDAVKGAKRYEIYHARSRFSEYEFERSQKGTEFDSKDIYGYYRVDAIGESGSLLSTATYSYEMQLFGNNVGVYSPFDDMSAVQNELDKVSNETDEFYDGRFAAIFKAGDYNELDLQLRYYTTYSGLGKLPTDTQLGKLNAYATQPGGNATRDFWRGIENLTINDNVRLQASAEKEQQRGVMGR